jgi:hypothetical protein
MKRILNSMARLGYLLGGIVLLFSLVPVALKSEWSWAAKVELQYFSELKHISDILRLVQAKFVDKETVSDQEKLIEGSIEGILKNWMTHSLVICQLRFIPPCRKKPKVNLAD